MLAQATQGAGPHNKQHALSASSLAICPKSGRLTAEAPACPLEVALKRARDLAKIKKKMSSFCHPFRKLLSFLSSAWHDALDRSRPIECLRMP